MKKFAFAATRSVSGLAAGRCWPFSARLPSLLPRVPGDATSTIKRVAGSRLHRESSPKRYL